MSSRPEGWKRLGRTADEGQERRRQDAIARQRQARRDLTMHVRAMAVPSIEADLEDITASMDMDVEVTSTKSRKKTREDRVKGRREIYCNQLSHPEWMVDIPSQLNGTCIGNGEGWYVLPRPDGKRCLVIAANGSTIARTQSGSVLKKFPSALPSGSRKTSCGTDQYCVLDCIFSESEGTFHILDVMCWKGYLLYDCTAEFRFYWLQDKLSETKAMTVTTANPYAFHAVPYFDCTPEGIQTAYHGAFAFEKDGLLFYCKAGIYALGLSPLVLLWKDPHTSPYPSQMTIVLQVDELLQCVTLDGKILATLALDFATLHEIVVGDLLRFSVDSMSWSTTSEGDVVVDAQGVHFQKRCSAQRGIADSWTKIAHILVQPQNCGLGHLLEAAMDAAVMDAE
ncbi:snurportin-like protein [Achlya hypogyna]|uniref:Snurportin-1 n=1 Tax=Achlya hypogyna TaxID=1202772 RepID=A0A1V9Y650_ACHHY|nr:snurportin-like protein [Achlya hypogyna]